MRQDPKTQRRKKRKQHLKSIIQREEDWRRCFICMLRNGDYEEKGYLETHHVIFGKGRRDKSEADGLTVRLCREHHREVHNESASRRRLSAIAQKAYERTHSREEWMRRYTRNYLEE